MAQYTRSEFLRMSAAAAALFGSEMWPRAAAAVGQALGTSRVESQPDSNLYLDVTVLLGREWVPELDGEEDEAGEVPWWDVRRFLR